MGVLLQENCPDSIPDLDHSRSLLYQPQNTVSLCPHVPHLQFDINLVVELMSFPVDLALGVLCFVSPLFSQSLALCLHIIGDQ